MLCCGPLQRAAQAVVTGDHEGRATGGRRENAVYSTYPYKLIVLASQALFTLMPVDLDDYERGALWKQLRHACASPPLWTEEYGGYQLRVLTIQTMSTSPMRR